MRARCGGMLSVADESAATSPVKVRSASDASAGAEIINDKAAMLRVRVGPENFIIKTGFGDYAKTGNHRQVTDVIPAIQKMNPADKSFSHLGCVREWLSIFSN